MYLIPIKEDDDLLNEDILWEMANARGIRVKIDDINFSFHFLTKSEMRHAIRVKITWNREKISNGNFDGYIEAHGDYRYYQSSKSKSHPSKKEVDRARMFVRKYKVLFAAVWEKKLDQNAVLGYFEGAYNFKQLVSQFEGITEKQFYIINHCNSLTELEKVVRENKIFNMND